MIVGSSPIFLKCIWNKSCSWAALLKFWFRTDLRRENSTGFYMQGRQSARQSLLTFLTDMYWSCSTSNFYVLIGQNLTGEIMRKIYAASGNLLTDSWRWQSFVSSCDVLNCLLLLDVQNEIQLLSGLFCNSWLVCLCAFWQIHRLSKSLEIRFRMASFSKMSLPTCPCFRRKRVEKSQAILEHKWWPWVYGLCGLSLYTSNDLTYNSIKPLDILWPQFQRKGSEEYLVMILAINRKLWANFLPRVHLEKEQTPGSRLKT